MDLIRQGLQIASDPRHTSWICPLLFAFEAALCPLLVQRIACTWLAPSFIHNTPAHFHRAVDAATPHPLTVRNGGQTRKSTGERTCNK